MALIQSRNIVDEWDERFEGEEKVSDPVSDEFGELDYAPTTRDFSDDFTAVCTIWRKGQKKPYIGKFSVRDARRAKLWNNPKKTTWVEHPKRMLEWRARAFAMPDGFADCLMGLSIREEVEDMTIEPVATQNTTKDDGEFADQMAAAMMGGRETQALPAPSEQPMEITIPQSKILVDAPMANTSEPITVSRITTPEPSSQGGPSGSGRAYRRDLQAAGGARTKLEADARSLDHRIPVAGNDHGVRPVSHEEFRHDQSVA